MEVSQLRKTKEEHGYTLVIVLLMIVFFLGLSTVFINTSLSHAKQEKLWIIIIML